MNSIYKKSELLFSLLLIAVYVAGTGFADGLSETLGMAKSVTAVLFSGLTMTQALFPSFVR